MAAVKAGISSLGVIPAKASIQFYLRYARWTPAFAGVTSLLVRPDQIPSVIPADAGIQLARERAKKSSTSGIRWGDASNCGHDDVRRLGHRNDGTSRR
jgi:hypothetical protein